MATSVVFPRVQFFADNGRLLIGGRIHTYIAGTSSRAPTYKDAARAQPNTNPIILDGRAEASIYLAEGVEYKFVIEDSKGALIMTQEPVYGAIWPDAASWPSDATLAYQYMLEAKAAASAIGPIKFYDTYAQADNDLPNLSEDDLVEIAHDESRASSPRARYRVESGALVFVIEFDIFYPGMTGSVSRPIQAKLRDLISLDDYVDTAHAISAAIASSKKVYIPFDMTLRIPADAPSLQSAIDHTYVYPGITATLLIQSGHKLSGHTEVREGDFSCYRIASEDSVVYLNASWAPGQSVLTGYNARMPVWAIMLNCEGKEVSGLETGVINVTYNSSLVIEEGCGVINGGSNSNGLFTYRNSKVTGFEAVFTDFGLNNVWITHISDGYLEKLIATGAGQYGVFASRASRVYMTGGDVSGAGTYGLCIRRSYVVALPFGSTTPPKFNNCGVFGVYASQGSTFISPNRDLLRPQFSGNPTHILAESGSLVCVKGTFSNSAVHAVNLTSGSKAILDESTFASVGASVIRCSNSEISARAITGQNAGSSGIVAQASIVNAPGANLSNAGSYGIHAYDGSLVSAPNVNVSNAGQAGLNVASSSVVADFVTAIGCGTGLIATDMSTVSVKQGVLTGYTTNGIIANRGSRVMAHSANAQKAGSNTATDAVVGSGSVIIFVSAAGGSNVVSNTFTANGILYQ